MEFLQTVISFLTSDLFADWLGAITAVVTAATGITMLTPTKTDNAIINAVLQLLNILAGNILKNKNEDA